MANKTGTGTESPLMKQYHEIKAQHPDTILLFRVGDFYETFGEDAVKTAKALNIVLTSRSSGYMNELALAGFPYHALDTYLHKLVKACGKVAICEQLEDPKATKKLVKRGVTEVITPGVLLSDKMLEAGKNNFLCALHFAGGSGSNSSQGSTGSGSESIIGVAFLDISTGEFFCGQGNPAFVKNRIDRYKPGEILIDRQAELLFSQLCVEDSPVTRLEEWVFKGNYAEELMLKHFGVASLKGFGIDKQPQGIVAAGAALHYLGVTQHENLQHITTVKLIANSGFMWLDSLTARNLNLFEPEETSLYNILNKTSTPMGARLLRRYMLFPLLNAAQLQERYNFVDFFLQDKETAGLLSEKFAAFGDLERLVSKIATLRATPREMRHLGKVLGDIRQLRSELKNVEFLSKWVDNLSPCADLRSMIEKTIAPDPAANPAKGQVIAKGIDEELDRLREIAFSGKDYLARLQQREAEITGITSLKLGFNNVFGYYLEVTNAHKDKVPADWIRKQTTTNAERYITEDLKKYEQEVLSAQEKIVAIEEKIYQNLLQQTREQVGAIQQNAQAIARVDVLLSFAIIAEENRYTCPTIIQNNSELKNNDSNSKRSDASASNSIPAPDFGTAATTIISIEEGRHPIIEMFLPQGEKYIPNNIYLDSEKQQILMITGPNMSGKSAVLRQTAIITYMAQIGSYVPATAARLSLIDKIFTRVGASDNLAAGESTFMTEMNEAANILNNATSQSLVLLDEIGRGTSTYDGISIAWAIAEYLHQNEQSRPLVLFATHYHELNEMESTFTRIKNYHVATKEADGRIIFLRKLVAGGSGHSFGIHVAQMAGMPQQVVARASEVLQQLEDGRSGRAPAAQGRAFTASPRSLTLAAGFPLNPSREPHAQPAPASAQAGAQPPAQSPAVAPALPPTALPTALPTAADLQSAPPPARPAPASPQAPAQPPTYQLSLFQLTDIDDNLKRIKNELQEIDINSLSPLEALNKLNEIKNLL
ncbi:MAG: DNA mismatch repair protein MutS [Bacteroidales bacterium]|jgi:DNA mismatch repair protein MutS|nr:DNA mismatch repair protein MutS [Bacteroidales bacterium]